MSADRWIRWTTIARVGLLALIAGTISYLHMHALVARHGQPGWVAALTPFSVDGMIVAASTTPRMTPAKALWSATAGGALALHPPDIVRLAPGARADLDVLGAPRHLHLSYRPDVPLTRTLDLDDLT